ncbi:MAG: type IV pilus assembly protein PilM [Candidatus Harrisonbacteria bacterium]|nr:type IV pilus assembly protein PilM [Candidatus Harrisonbacteria bacterium]
MSLFSLFRKRPSGRYLGVDIGTSSIKAAELSGSRQSGFSLERYGILEAHGQIDRANSALQASGLKLMDKEIVSYLRLLRSKAGFLSSRATASLPSFVGFTTLLELPVSSDKEIAQTITFQARNYIPLPITTVTLDWIKVAEKTEADGTRKQQVLLISIPNEVIEAYTSIFSQAGLQLEALELENISAARILTIASKTPKLVVDIGGRSTSFSVGKEGELKFAGQTDYASGTLTQSLSQALNIHPQRAEDLKRSTRLSSEASERELSTIMLPVIDAILSEASRTKNSFEKSYGEAIDGVILSGSGAKLPGLVEYVSKQLELQTSAANPGQYIGFPAEVDAIKEDLGPTLAVAMGLALKNI